jgi:hypothetical protein
VNRVKGIDLLTAEKTLLSQLGFKEEDALLLSRMETSIQQLVNYQAKIDLKREAKLGKNEKQNETAYAEFKHRFENMVLGDLPFKVEVWTVYHLYYYLMKEDGPNKEVFSLFLKPVACGRVDGSRLLKTIQDHKAHEVIV